jgi:hypothetical protein
MLSAASGMAWMLLVVTRTDLRARDHGYASEQYLKRAGPGRNLAAVL